MVGTIREDFFGTIPAQTPRQAIATGSFLGRKSLGPQEGFFTASELAVNTSRRILSPKGAIQDKQVLDDEKKK